MALHTRLTRRLSLRHPVLLAPMGGVAGGALAAAVSRAGGLGLIGGGYADPQWLEQEFAAAANARVGCGFITWALARRPEALDRALDRAPAAVMLSFGDAAPFLPRIKRAGALAICQVQSLAQARAALGEGADILVAQGAEAGGHGASRASLPLIPAIVDLVATQRPEALVLAAGGIADGRGLAAALMLGADGVLMGTGFCAAAESLASPAWKARIVALGGDDTLRTTVFDIARGFDWPAEYTGRALRNRFTEAWHGREAALAAAEADDRDTALVFAGEGIDLVRAVEPAEAILKRVVREAETALSRDFTTPAASG